jgi:hypothetical protein
MDWFDGQARIEVLDYQTRSGIQCLLYCLVFWYFAFQWVATWMGCCRLCFARLNQNCVREEERRRFDILLAFSSSLIGSNPCLLSIRLITRDSYLLATNHRLGAFFSKYKSLLPGHLLLDLKGNGGFVSYIQGSMSSVRLTSSANSTTRGREVDLRVRTSTACVGNEKVG